MHRVDAYNRGRVLADRAPIGRTVAVPPLLDFGRVASREFCEGLGVEFFHARGEIDFEHVVAKFSKAGADCFRIRQFVDAFDPSVGDESFVDDGGIGIVDRQQLETDFRGELIAFVAAKGVRGAGRERLAVEFFLIGVAAEVIFFFEEQEIFAAEEICGGEAGGACADDDDFDFAGGCGEIERVAVANFVTDFEVFAVDLRAALSRRPDCRMAPRRACGRSGQPAATEPATTNLMKSRREFGRCHAACSCCCVRACSRRSCGSVPRLRVRMRYQITMSATRDRKDERGDGVDLRRDAAAEASPDFERQRIVAADQEKCDGDFVHREREDQQARRRSRESFRFGRVTRQNVCHGVAPRSSEASSWARSIFCRPAKSSVVATEISAVP